MQSIFCTQILWGLECTKNSGFQQAPESIFEPIPMLSN